VGFAPRKKGNFREKKKMNFEISYHGPRPKSKKEETPQTENGLKTLLEEFKKDEDGHQ